MTMILSGTGAIRPASGGAIEISRRDLLALAALGMVANAPGAAIAAGSEGQLTWGVHVSLAPIWFDPADNSGIITPFLVLYALHDAMVKPMPGQVARAEPRRVLYGGRRRSQLRVCPAPRSEVPQWRSGDG